MLSYRHGFHAGNFADVQKHAVLTLLVQALLRKEAPFCYLDTHAGAAVYDLQSALARKTDEYQAGIGRLWERDDTPPEAAAYLAAVRALNHERGENGLRYYPGSPWLVDHLRRAQDRMVLSELHTTEAPLLQEAFAKHRRLAVHHMDGYQALRAFLPPQERRGLVLIDPAYERADEFRRATEALVAAWQRWPTGIFALWYPIARRDALADFYRRLTDSGMRKVLRAELVIARDDVPHRLNGSGLIIINPPWQVDGQIRALQDWLWKVLAVDGAGGPRLDWLVPE
ncbi:MAG: 23S rRNA (adenine(2030)-N(6))-methyltransferase RlmJ [Gammaproteobacteria bacterium]|nr:23S rRNA (adenine(2030)-N(6))-methyltransferase RlmJ [Gammaproteobacteria bacterium]